MEVYSDEENEPALDVRLSAAQNIAFFLKLCMQPQDVPPSDTLDVPFVSLETLESDNLVNAAIIAFRAAAPYLVTAASCYVLIVFTHYLIQNSVENKPKIPIWANATSIPGFVTDIHLSVTSWKTSIRQFLASKNFATCKTSGLDVIVGLGILLREIKRAVDYEEEDRSHLPLLERTYWAAVEGSVLVKDYLDVVYRLLEQVNTMLGVELQNAADPLDDQLQVWLLSIFIIQLTSDLETE
jgi:hypothetical protein